MERWPCTMGFFITGTHVSRSNLKLCFTDPLFFSLLFTQTRNTMYLPNALLSIYLNRLSCTEVGIYDSANSSRDTEGVPKF